MNDTVYVGGCPFVYKSVAIWAEGDFDFDGDFGADDSRWLLTPTGGLLIVR